MKLKTALLGAVASAAVMPLMAHAQDDTARGTRGSDGQVNIIYWQAPSIMNPYLSGGTKDLEAASLVIERLARYDAPIGVLKIDIEGFETRHCSPISLPSRPSAGRVRSSSRRPMPRSGGRIF